MCAGPRPGPWPLHLQQPARPCWCASSSRTGCVRRPCTSGCAPGKHQRLRGALGKACSKCEHAHKQGLHACGRARAPGTAGSPQHAGMASIRSMLTHKLHHVRASTCAESTPSVLLPPTAGTLPFAASPQQCPRSNPSVSTRQDLQPDGNRHHLTATAPNPCLTGRQPLCSPLHFLHQPGGRHSLLIMRAPQTADSPCSPSSSAHHPAPIPIPACQHTLLIIITRC